MTNTATTIDGPSWVPTKGNSMSEDGPQAGATETASVEHNRRIAREWIEQFNARNHGYEAEILASDYIAYVPDSLSPAPLDHDAWTGFLQGFLEGFPDLHLEIEDAVADQQMVAQRILFTGTHTGNFQGLPPTGRTVRFSGLELNHVRDGRVDKHWFQLDQVTMMQQLGLTIVPGPRLISRLIGAKLKALVGSRRG